MITSADFFAVMLIIVVFVLSGALGLYCGQQSIRTSAIEVGYAEYVVNPKTGETKFQWKQPSVIATNRITVDNTKQ